MAVRTETHQVKGMQRDFSMSKANKDFVFDALNIRITAREGNTLLSITNEKGNSKITLHEKVENVLEETSIKGVVLGHCVINKTLVLFSTDSSSDIPDYIYKINKEGNNYILTTLYSGKLEFDNAYPIECIGIFENEAIQKVYWVDGKNPVRFINVATDDKYSSDDPTIFNFVRNLKLEEEITITCNNDINGMFPSGTVQYAFTYYNKYGSESNIVYQSPLYYSYMNDRGGSPEEISSNSFDLTLSNLDRSFEYIRVYSIIRSSLDNTPIVRRIADLKVSEDTLRFTDSNTTGESVDTTFLLYVGGENIIPECMTQKDNTLFLGNYKVKNPIIGADIKNDIKQGSIEFSAKTPAFYESRDTWYNHTIQLQYNSYEITTFKANELYRFGIQFQNKEGKWSEAIYIKDEKHSTYPSTPTGSMAAPEGKYGTALRKAYYNIDRSVIEKLVSKGYTKARGVIVYPDDIDREVICQGVLNPTVFNALNREGTNRIPYAQSSWFFRPYTTSYGSTDPHHSVIEGDVPTFIDYGNINSSTLLRQSEIGLILDNDIKVDANIVTMHSPDIEFKSTINNFQNTDLKYRIVGYVKINGNKAAKQIIASTPSADALDDIGFYDAVPENFSYPSVTGATSYGGEGKILLSGINWIGKAVTADGNGWKALGDYPLGWLVSPWHKGGSLVNDFARRQDSYIVAKLKNNRLLNYRVSYDTEYADYYTTETTPNYYNRDVRVGVFDSNEVSVTYIDSSITYQGNVDEVLLGSQSNRTEAPVTYSTGEDVTSMEALHASLYAGEIQTVSSVDNSLTDEYRYANSPVSMKYKSTKHAVFCLGEDEGEPILLPEPTPTPIRLPIEGEESADFPIFSNRAHRKKSFEVNGFSILWLAELYREVPNKFGGNTEDALMNNRWQVAGDSVSIIGTDGEPLPSATVEYLQGDTYYQRYDCLKTYPYSLEDENNVTEILSFFCETTTNVDGKYDKNRRNVQNLALSPANFNLLNPVYNQSNNYFNYFISQSSLDVNNFSNSVIWSNEKFLGEEVDSWTNINAASNINLDGSKGEITALKTFNNEIYCFQKEGISNILFNSRVQIPTSDGVPIEITNGLKVQGKRYLSNIGCNNKWSIAESPNGLYFVDNITDGIYLFNGKLTSLSDSLGFRQWVKENNSLDKWNPEEFKNFKTHYDKNNRDVYFTNNKYCLCYSELLNQFTSFMSYENTPYMFNIENALFSIKKDEEGKYNIWEQFKGEYNKFYGESKPYSLTFISNSDPFYDKIFNNLEFRSDTYEWITKDKEGNDVEPYWKLSDKTFDTIQVENEYQDTGEVELKHVKDSKSNLKRKFRVWRIQIPRDKNGRDRIRNTWTKVKLTHKNPSNCKTELHDLMVHYFI